MPTADPSLTSAEVVSVSPVSNLAGDGPYNKFLIERAGKPYDSRLLGVISSFTDIDKQPPTSRPVALVGRVPVKVSLENGAIEIGDYLTASATRPGYAMKATQPGQVIGQALQATSSDDGKILVFVNPGYYLPDETINAIKDMNLQLANINTIDQENSLRDILISWLGNVGNKIGDLYAKVIHSDKVETKELCVGNTCVTESQLQQLLQNQNGGGNYTPPPTPSPTPEPEVTPNPEPTTTPPAAPLLNQGGDGGGNAAPAEVPAQ